MENITLSQLNKLIKTTLENSLEPSYWVIAEIGEMRVNARGHCYLELVEKEDDTILAKSRATIWSYTFRNLSAWFQSVTGSELAAGMRILANIQVTFHEVYGFNLNIKDIDATFTLGEREKKRQETIMRLEQDGVIDMNKQLALPLVPDRLAIISSPTAAGYEDFIEQIENNVYGYRLIHRLYPASMQGNEAPSSIIQALHKIVDSDFAPKLIVLIRGGGASMDLDCFDDYELASHLAQVPLPVVTGIGHERDTTISDMVAHTSLKTPTAVAEFLINGVAQYEATIEETFRRIGQIARERVSQEKLNIAEIAGKVRLQSQSIISEHKYNLLKSVSQLQYLSKSTLANEAVRLDNIEAKLKLLDPARVLQRGYTYTSLNGSPVAKAEIKKGDEIETFTETKIITSTVKKVENYGEN